MSSVDTPTKETLSLQAFEDLEMDQQLLRAFSTIGAGGATVGECLAVASHIESHQPETWVTHWEALAEQLESEALLHVKKGHTVSAADLYTRASMYYYCALYFENIESQRRQALNVQSRQAFLAACPFLETPCEFIEIPFEDTLMPGYFVQPDTRVIERPTLILVGGFDSSNEELYLMFGKEAVKRGFNVLVFEGPGQGGYPIKDNNEPSYFIPDYERVLTEVVNTLVARPEVDPQKIALCGISLGGYLATRAAAHDSRIAALITNTPICNLWNYFKAFFQQDGIEQIPDFSLEALRKLEADKIRPMEKNNLMAIFTRFGAKTLYDLMEYLQAFIVSPQMLTEIACPTLACLGEQEGQAPKQQFTHFCQFIQGPLTQEVFTSEWGAEAHCQLTNTNYFGIKAYDWLTETLS
mgnify:CR=1 FL=1|tara:strand:+ start:7502 stop:8734 length:1233 start_codon:yes stop_codon:yes gene_type:complete